MGKRSDAAAYNTSTENSLRPDAPFYAVGDIHGCVDLLQVLLGQIGRAADEQIVFLGDYIDRGPDSAATLKALYDLSHRRPGKVTFLLGNHEKMMCDFIDDPLGRGARWSQFGGRETLASYGIDIPMTPSSDELLEACDALEAALPSPILPWLRAMPLSWNSGNVWCVHAAMDPERAPDMQRSRTLLWGHKAFLGQRRQDDNCVVHGHTVVQNPSNRNSRIAVDTGAYMTGRLTAAYVSQESCEFIST